ncbi:hypothetical protein CfE428DRAFT_3064 [Chthoniobacter flavus Ellin428]|uniref:Uncharacterized protein n=1 Tax=Chthoniobacter flavus Ellin428 TaxID=497964 RepID=B4D2D9_9BACT|nr:hypothetical protein CfE428DRAFT_3064 [Chthoniobacter flavus Ellin428]TCO90493.1 hypothetical protein EV701_110116 [Chthoniobacter flavus]
MAASIGTGVSAPLTNAPFMIDTNFQESLVDVRW